MEKHQLRVWGSLATTVVDTQTLLIGTHSCHRNLCTLSCVRSEPRATPTQHPRRRYRDGVALGICITASKVQHAGYAAPTKACAVIVSFTFKNVVSATEITVVYTADIAVIGPAAIVADVAPVVGISACTAIASFTFKNVVSAT
ncbi:hypothetical protein GN244_ATG06011 [Phytophthora infestans]|uniref:Uncharacterized protein n=1 Tax=Phytophthora infestans TaxID=4787 RepID=A0A833T3E3_PHYIN|nr:hypothetical protein GN244_ATG06011 [Phytophthora infestans]